MGPGGLTEGVDQGVTTAALRAEAAAAHGYNSGTPSPPSVRRDLAVVLQALGQEKFMSEPCTARRVGRRVRVL